MRKEFPVNACSVLMLSETTFSVQVIYKGGQWLPYVA